MEMDQYDVAESDDSVTVCAVLLGGELAREVAVSINTTDAVGTATGEYRPQCLLITHHLTCSLTCSVCVYVCVSFS